MTGFVLGAIGLIGSLYSLHRFAVEKAVREAMQLHD